MNRTSNGILNLEFGGKRNEKYKIRNVGCDDETEGIFFLEEEQFDFLNKLFKELNKNSEYCCMPRIHIKEVEE